MWSGRLSTQHPKRDLQATLGTLLLNIARTGALLVDPVLHAEVQRTLSQDSDTYVRVRAALAAIQDENGLETPIYTLTDFDQVSGRARFYELLGLGGRFAGRLPEVESGAYPQVDVTRPLRAWVIDGKIVSANSVSGVVLRLGTRQLDARMDEPLPPLTNIRLRLNYPGLGYDSGDLYAKVLGDDERTDTRLTRIWLTSVEPVDQAILEGFFESLPSAGPSDRCPQ